MKKQRNGLQLTKSPLALAIASTLMAGANAQTNGNTANAQTTDVIEVVGQKTKRDPASMKFTRPLLDTAQTVNVVPSDLIEERGATTLRDVLRNVSGISMQAGEGGAPAGDQLSIRGYSARTDIFVDNVRDFGGYTRDPFNLEQVEVVKGPSSDYSGRGSTGGSINLVSKAPSLAEQTSASLSMGTDEFTRATLDSNVVLGETSAARLNLMYHDQDVAGRDVVTNERWGIAPSVAFGLETDTQLTLSAFHMEQDNVPDYGIPWVPDDNEPLAVYRNEAPPVDFENWYGLKARDFEEIGTTMATVQVDHAFDSNVRLRNLTRWGITDRDSMITAPRFVSANSTDIRRSDEKYRDQTDEIISNQTDLRFDLNAGDIQHSLLFGLELAQESETRHLQAGPGADSPPTDLFNPNPNDPYLENYQRTGGEDVADSNTVAVYVSDSVQINERWQLNAGLRWDSFDLSYNPEAGETNERTDRMLSYRAGLVYKPADHGTIYFGYGTSFNPSAEALSLTESSRSPGITGLDPEENRSFELGTKWQLLDQRFFVSAAMFRTEKTNARTENPNVVGDLLILKGEQLVEGIELGFAGNLTEKLSLTAGYTWLQTEIEESLNAAEIGNELPNSPEHSLNLWAAYTLLDNLEMGFGALYVDDRFNNTSNTRIAPDYWIYEASASYVFNPKLSFRLNLQNITDEEYIDYVGGGHFIPGLGRTVLLSSNFTF